MKYTNKSPENESQNKTVPTLPFYLIILQIIFTVDFDINLIYFSIQYLTNLVSVEKPWHNSVIVSVGYQGVWGFITIITHEFLVCKSEKKKNIFFFLPCLH